jgi:hypothetical protein
MVSEGKKREISKKTKLAIVGAVGFIVVIIGLIFVFCSQSAIVFRGMNEEMLKVKSVTVDQKITIKSKIGASFNTSSKMFMNLANNKELSTKGNFSFDTTSSGYQMSAIGDLIEIGSNAYVKYSKLSSTASQLSSSFSVSESKLKNNWMTVGKNEMFSSFARMSLDEMTNILPTPFANLNDTQRKNVLAILRDKSMYTINGSSRVEIGGVSAYKYSLTYNSDQYKKVVKAISGYVKYFKSNNFISVEIKPLDVWVNTDTKQIIKIEYKSSSKQEDVTDTITFSGYNQTQKVEAPSKYSSESVLLSKGR